MTCSGPYFLMRPVYSSTPCIAGELIRCCSLISWLQGQLLALSTCEQGDKEHLTTAMSQETEHLPKGTVRKPARDITYA